MDTVVSPSKSCGSQFSEAPLGLSHNFLSATMATLSRADLDALRLTENEMVVCGMSLGYADPEATANQLVTEREPVSEFARFLS